MRTYRYVHLDVFTDHPFTGNQRRFSWTRQSSTRILCRASPERWPSPRLPSFFRRRPATQTSE